MYQIWLYRRWDEATSAIILRFDADTPVDASHVLGSFDIYCTLFQRVALYKVTGKHTTEFIGGYMLGLHISRKEHVNE